MTENYTIKMHPSHLQFLMALLLETPLPLKQSGPIYENLQRQMLEQDAVSAIPVQGVFVDDDTSSDDFVVKAVPHAQV